MCVVWQRKRTVEILVGGAAGPGVGGDVSVGAGRVLGVPRVIACESKDPKSVALVGTVEELLEMRRNSDYPGLSSPSLFWKCLPWVFRRPEKKGCLDRGVRTKGRIAGTRIGEEVAGVGPSSG